MFYSKHALAMINARRLFAHYGYVDGPTKKAADNAKARILRGEPARPDFIRL
jgi:hypothetical protein